MKRIIYTFTASLALIAAVQSCDSILDKAPLDSFADNFVGYGNGGGSGSYYFPTLNDNQADATFRDWNFINNIADNTDWSDPYVEIRRANIMINRLGRMSLNETTTNHWLGVARMMRALQYYWLVRQFGDVPLIDHELQVSEKDVIYAPRTDRDKVMDFVLEDLNFACGNIKDVTNKTDWSRDLANAIKAEVCLFEGTYCKYRKEKDGQKAPDSNRAETFLKEAKTAAAAVMAKGYTLKKSYQSVRHDKGCVQRIPFHRRIAKISHETEQHRHLGQAY